jgi:hypothetical protein
MEGALRLVSLFVATSDPGNSRLHVEVNILVKPEVFVSAESVAFGTVSSSSLKANPGALDFSRQTLVISRRQGEMRITSVTTDVSFLTLQATPRNRRKASCSRSELIPRRCKPGR